MDMLIRETGHLFSLPVALIFQNESEMEEQSDLIFNTTTPSTINVSPNDQNWKKVFVMNELQRLEKVGDTIRKELKWSFILHAYGFGCLFFILAFYTFFSVINIRSFITSRPYMCTINGFLCLLGGSRATSLFIDPYNLKENMPKLIGQVLWDLGFPSIISSFCFVQLAFLQFTQLQIGPEYLRRKSCLSLIVTAHFLLTIGMDMVVASNENLMVGIMKHVVQYILLIWGVFLCSNFLYTGYKIMSIVRSMPLGIKYKESPEFKYRELIQLATPNNNLAEFMTATFLPTLCTPKIHQQDNTSVSVVGFRSDGNARILESESIPMLEEITDSSGDEYTPKPLARVSSTQSQKRHSQKINLQPKLTLGSISDEANAKEMPQLKHLENKPSKWQMPKNQSLKFLPFESDSNHKLNSKILKRKDNFTCIQSDFESTNTIKQKTCFENENFRFPNEKKTGIEIIKLNIYDNQFPKSGPSNLSESEANERRVIENQNNKKILTKLINEISKDLSEMQILRDEKFEVVESKENKCDPESLIDVKIKADFNRGCDYKEESLPSEKDNIKKSFRKEYDLASGATRTRSNLNLNGASSKTILQSEKKEAATEKNKNRRKKKSHSWIKNAGFQDEEKEIKETQENPTNRTLGTALNQIGYVNKGASSSNEDLEKVKKTKIEWILNITYVTAMWGLILCLSNMGKTYGSFGIPVSRKEVSSVNSTYLQDLARIKTIDRGNLFSSWPWLWFQTFCRALELAMGCAMANITRQPAANYRYPRVLSFRSRETFNI